MAGIYYLTAKGAAAIGDGDDGRTDDSVPDPAMVTAAIPRSAADAARELQIARHRAEIGDEPPF